MSEPTVQESVIYHWIIIQATAEGTLNVALPASRAGIYAWVTDKLHESLGTGKFAVVFFDAQPNDIPGGAR